MARGFRMEIHYRDVQPLPPEMEEGATYHAGDDAFLGAIDVLSMHIPGGEGDAQVAERRADRAHEARLHRHQQQPRHARWTTRR